MFFIRISSQNLNYCNSISAEKQVLEDSGDVRICFVAVLIYYA